MFYEPVEKLSSFADQFTVGFPLLADPGSKIITDFGILNTTIDESDAPFYGIPFPGSYVIGADGTIIAKYFEQNSLIRVHPDKLLRAALGAIDSTEHEVATDGPAPAEVEMQVRFDGEELRAFLVSDLLVTLRVPQGQHLYGPPVSEGLVVTSVELEPHDLVGRQSPILPPTHAHELAGTGEVLQVYEGDVQIRVPLVYNAQRVERDADGARNVHLAGTVRWQACDDTACHIPRSERFTISVPVGRPTLWG